MTVTYMTREQLKADTGRDWLVECENVLEAHDFAIDHLEGDHRRLAERVNNEVFGPNMGLWDCGGCMVWAMSDEGRLRLQYDGGALYDFFSIDGDGAHMTPTFTYGLRDAVRAIGQDFGLEMEAWAGWCDVFYE